MFIGLSSSSLLAQTGVIRFERLSTPHGLSQVSVHSIVQDGQGFLWFGTEDGLNRFDGYSFRVYRHNLLDSTSLSNNWIECLYIDRRATLWVGTYGGGLNRYDHLTDRFVRYRHDPNDPQSLSNDFIYALAEDEAGNLWLAT
jgi:ligand-binding sensor domain-containing protein